MFENIINKCFTVSFFGIFLSIIAFHNYLLLQKEAKYYAKIYTCFWPELIFRFRDFTKYKKSKLHYLYYFAVLSVFMFFGSAIMSLFVDLALLEKPLNYIGIFAAVIPIGLVLVLWVSLAKVTYY